MPRVWSTIALAILVSLVLPPSSAPAALQIAISKGGKRSAVHLLDVSHVPQSTLMTVPPAEDGLRLVFLVVSLLPGDGTPTISELRDFAVDGQSYRSMSTARLRQAIEPTTYMLNPSAMTKFDDSVTKLLSGTSRSIGMVVDISGATLPTSGTARLRLQAGWNDALEDWEFEFDLKKVPADTPFSRYRGSH